MVATLETSKALRTKLDPLYIFNSIPFGWTKEESSGGNFLFYP